MLGLLHREIQVFGVSSRKPQHVPISTVESDEPRVIPVTGGINEGTVI
jgi:hypothetical protein